MIDPMFIHTDEYYYEVIRKNLKKIRRERNLTQQALADLTGLSRQYICDIENSARCKHPSIAVIGRIADSLNIKITSLLEEL